MKSSIDLTIINLTSVLVPEDLGKETIVPASEILTRTPNAFENEFAIIINHKDHESLTYHRNLLLVAPAAISLVC